MLRLPPSAFRLGVTAGAILVVGVIAANASAGQLQWRRGGPAANHAASGSTSSTQVSTQPRRDAAVQPAAYETQQTSAGPSFAGEPVSQAALRSVVVHRDEQTSDDEGFRSAQRPYGGAAASPSDSRYEKQLSSPFGDSTPQQGAEPQGAKEETMPLPPAEGAPNDLFPPTDNGPNMPESQEPPPSLPRYQQPTKQAPAAAPGTSETPRTFQPQRPPQTPRPRGSHDPFDNEPHTGTGPTQPSPLGVAGGSHLEPEVLKAEQGKAQQFCSEELSKEKANTLNNVDLSIAVPGTQGEDYPFECSIDEGTMYSGRCWDQITYMWKASALCHKPLYFEDEQLERYGHSWGPCCDPLVSGAHFFCTLPVLPYCMGVNPPCECMYALGHYRPGSCAPYMINPVPLSCRGAAGEAGAVAGAIWFLP
jgi:hypothetical protein